MKILFICPSLEPNRDGVGDYTRRLCSELIIKGYQVTIIALNDQFLLNEFEGIQQENGNFIPVLRLPSQWNSTRRFERAKQFVDALNPEWISLQYVSYGFQKKGLPFGIGQKLKSFGNNYQWQVMFHEIWLGESPKSSVKEVTIGFFQKVIVKQLFKKLCPIICFTSNNFYSSKLSKLGVNVKVFPVFGSLPPGRPNINGIYEELPIHILKNRGNYFIFSFFGSVNPEQSFFDKINHIRFLSEQHKKNILITHIGYSLGVDNLFQELNEKTGIEIFLFNTRSSQEIADFFCHIDFALSTHPKILFEKSSSISAFLTSGLNVILLNKSFIYDNRFISGIYEIDEVSNLLDILIKPKDFSKKYSFNNTVDGYTKLFHG